MDKIVTKAGELIIIKMPKEAYDIELIDGDTIFYWLPENGIDGYSKTGQVDFDRLSYEWYKKLSDLNDNEIEEFVDKFEIVNHKDFINTAILGFSDIILIDRDGRIPYKDYMNQFNNAYTKRTAKESFKSLLELNNINLDEDEILIIKCS
jgi:hypothetical protein